MLVALCPIELVLWTAPRWLEIWGWGLLCPIGGPRPPLPPLGGCPPWGPLFSPGCSRADGFLSVGLGVPLLTGGFLPLSARFLFCGLRGEGEMFLPLGLSPGSWSSGGRVVPVSRWVVPWLGIPLLNCGFLPQSVRFPLWGLCGEGGCVPLLGSCPVPCLRVGGLFPVPPFGLCWAGDPFADLWVLTPGRCTISCGDCAREGGVYPSWAIARFPVLGWAGCSRFPPFLNFSAAGIPLLN